MLHWFLNHRRNLVLFSEPSAPIDEVVIARASRALTGASPCHELAERADAVLRGGPKCRNTEAGRVELQLNGLL